MNNRKSQTAIEFVILTNVMIVAFLVFYIMIQGKLIEANRDNTDQSAKHIADLIINEVRVAESVSNGYSRQFQLPDRVNNVGYNTSIMTSGNVPEIIVQYSGRERVYFIPQTYVNPASTVGRGLNNITKENNIITIMHVS